MAKSILPSGEELNVSPEEILRYINPDGLRQLLRQERLRWNLKPNRDADYYDNQRLFKYSGEFHNEGLYQRIEIRTFPDNGAYSGYAGLNIDSGLFGFVHNVEQWDKAISDEAVTKIVNRVIIGAMAKIPDRLGYGLDDEGRMVPKTYNRMAAIVFEPWDGRAYLLSNDDPTYVNNETRSVDERIPERSIARIGDIPTRMTQLMNDFDFVADPDYRHTDNNFTNSHRFILDNIDDRTFVYPEISKDASGDWIENFRVGLDGEPGYGESDGEVKLNSQPDLGKNPDLGDYGDRLGEAVSSYNHNKNFSGAIHPDGYFPGIFRSIEELERVDLIDQLQDLRTHKETPGGKRSVNYYVLDGKWSPNWFDRIAFNDSYLAQSLSPANMEIAIAEEQPVPYSGLSQTGDQVFDRTKLHQWRYNRVEIKYYSKDITISIVDPGMNYKAGDILRWTFGDDVFLFTVRIVGSNGQIQKGDYKTEKNRIFEQDPSTHGIGIPFSNMSGVGSGARLAVSCKATIETVATQIKNNLYAYVDVTPTVRSDDSTPWSDVALPDSQGGKVAIRSTAAGPAHSGINAGRGGPIPENDDSGVRFYEHGGNATAGAHVHLFRYVLNTQNPTWVIRDGIQVFTGKWVDQGPMGVERPCDIKALYLSNPDTNNFNNYYKFMIDGFFDSINRNPDATVTKNKNSVSLMYFHADECDPEPNQRFTDFRVDPESGICSEVDITDKVLYLNAATGVFFMYNSTHKNDPKFGYGMRAPGWHPAAGATTR
ncbi:MAG: hypothetical protein NC489_11545 [Ruminococcus flavefaciens]|nr:hypothetical protein [Ruminococcus flavefaciens]